MAQDASQPESPMPRREFLISSFFLVAAGALALDQWLKALANLAPEPPAELTKSPPATPSPQPTAPAPTPTPISPETPVPAKTLIDLEIPLHSKMKTERIAEFLAAAEQVFPGAKLTPTEVLALIYTEGAFEDMAPGTSGDTGPLQVIPVTMAETFARVKKVTLDPKTKTQTRTLFQSLGLPNESGSLDILTKRFGKDIGVALAAGILNLQRTANYVDTQIKANNLPNLPESTIIALRAAGHNRFLAPKPLLEEIMISKPTKISPADIDLVLGNWQNGGGKIVSIATDLDPKGQPIYKNVSLTPESIKNLRNYLRRDAYYYQIFSLISNLAEEGKIAALPPDFPKTIKVQVEKWLAEDFPKGDYSDTSSPDRVTALLQIIIPKKLTQH